MVVPAGSIMKDDRVAARLIPLEALFDSELAKLQAHPPSIWERLSGFCGEDLTANELRDDCIHKAFVATGFVREIASYGHG